MKNEKKEIIEALLPKKTYRLSWVDEVKKEVEVEASSEEEAREMFFNGDMDFSGEVENDIEYCEDSLEIEEVEKNA